jgi:hypothetical protein
MARARKIKGPQGCSSPTGQTSETFTTGANRSATNGTSVDPPQDAAGGNGADHAPDFGPALTFLTKHLLGRTTAMIAIESFVNNDAAEGKKFPPRAFQTRDPERVLKFVKEYNRAPRGLFFGASPVKGPRSKENVVELVLVWGDVDLKHVAEDGDTVLKTLKALPCPPHAINFSGHGYHPYWQIRVLEATAENRSQHEALLKRLAIVLAGDPMVAQCAAVLRIPGTHNSKYGEWHEVTTVYDRGGPEYAIEELAAWLDTAGPVLTAKEINHVAGQNIGLGPKNPFERNEEQFAGYAAERVNTDARLAAMRFQGPGNTSVHATELSVTASYACAGCDPDEVVEYVLSHVFQLSEARGWDLEQERRDLRKMLVSWYIKHPEYLLKLPAGTAPPWVTNNQQIWEVLREQAKSSKEHSEEAAAEAKSSTKEHLEKAAQAGVAGDPRIWPKLAPEALHGLAGKVVRLFDPHTEADPVALLLQFLVYVGNVLDRGPYYLVESTQHYTNLFVVLAGYTSKSRKGTGGDRIRALMRSVKLSEWWVKECIQSGLSSGEGLIWAIRDPISKKDRDGNDVITDEGIADKRLLLDEREFFQALAVMKREGNTASPLVRNAWDGLPLGSLTKNSPARCKKPMISIIGHITEEELRRTLDLVSIANGYANRFLFAMVRRSKFLPRGGKLQQSAINALGEEIGEHIIKWFDQWLVPSGDEKQIELDEEAGALWDREYRNLSEGLPGLLGAITGRAEAQTIRLALIYAVLDGSGEIKLAHLKAALAVWRYCEDSARYIFGDSIGDPFTDELLAALRSSGGMGRTQINDYFKRNHSRDKIDAALATLLRAGKVRSEKRSRGTAGRPEEFWVPAG